MRELAADASVNPNTMQKALQELETRGLVSTRRTAGRFITEERERIDMLRNTKAEEQLQNFLESMKKLGFDRDETLKLLTKKLKEKD